MMGLFDEILKSLGNQANNEANNQNNISAQNNASNAQNNEAGRQVGLGGLLGSLLGGAAGNNRNNAGAGNNVPPLDLGSLLSGLLGGNMQAGGSTQQNGGGAGTSLFEVIALAKEKFKQAASWESTGPNEPVSPEEVKNVVGEEKIAAIAQATNHSTTEVLASLAEEIPKAIDAATPNGPLTGNSAGNNMSNKA